MFSEHLNVVSATLTSVTPPPTCTGLRPYVSSKSQIPSLPVNLAVEMENFIVHNPHVTLDQIGTLGVFRPALGVQAAEEEDENSNPAEVQFWKIVQDRVSKLTSSDAFKSTCSSIDAEWTCAMFENIHHAYHWFQKTDNYYMWASLVYKLFTGKSSGMFVLEKWNEIFGMSPEETEVQADFGDALKFMRTSFDAVELVGQNPVVKKFKKLFSFLLVQGYLERFGLKLSDEEYSRLEQRTLAMAYSGKRGLWMSAFDTLLFLSEKFYEFYETRDISVFLHTSSEYAEWHKECDRLIGLADFVGNLGAHGTSYFTYIANIDDAIEKGDAYMKYSKARGAVESAYLMKRLSALRVIKLTQITRCAAQEERQAPFGVLVTGHSSVAKSSFSKMLFYYFGHLRGLDTGSRFMYRRNVADDFWSNFDTSKWCIQLDDIACLLPSKSAQVDPTLGELLNIANNVPYVPNQADLKDKGNTPVRCQLLIATSNAEHLNAHEYFYCPLAVQRRLPFIVEVTPKKCFLHENGHFIDPAKLEATPGEYPNFWIIKVKKIVPYMEGNQERCRLVESVETTYEDVGDFLRDYGHSITQHFKNQESSLDCDGDMAKIEVCTTCAYPKYRCTCTQVQSLELTSEVKNEWIPHPRVSNSKAMLMMFLNWYIKAFMWCLTVRWHLWLLQTAMRYSVGRKFVYKTCMFVLPEHAQIVLLGVLNGINTMPARWKALSERTRLIIGVVGAAAASAGVYYGAKAVLKKTRHCVALPEQGNKFRTTEEQLEKETTSNVWYNSTLETSRFDLPLTSQSLVKKTPQQLRDMFARNVVRLCSRVGKGEVHVRQTCGVFVRGGYLLANAHLFGNVEDECELEIISSPVADGINTNQRIRVRLSEIKFNREKDLCMLKVLARPPEKDIVKFWSTKKFTITRTCEVRRTVEGTVDVSDVYGVTDMPNCEVPSLNITVPILQGTMDRETRNGDCGSLVIAVAPLGAVLTGIHLLGKGRTCGALLIQRDEIEALCALVDASEILPLDVVGGGEPMLSVQDRKVVLGELNVRSMSRYIASGTLRSYGTLNLPEARYKSHVTGTPLQEEMKEHFQIEVDHGRPAMSGYEPWRNNLVKMVEPENTFDRVALQECTEAFIADIVDSLPAGWEKDLVFLSNKAAVNGLPGVKFVDGVNRNSSMGYPWNTTKRNYLETDACEKYPDGVTFPDEIWERVAKIEECYSEGRRAFPVFSAHLKDCATPFDKIEKKKTRVFTGQPVDHCLVTRKYLLSFVRLVQKNKFAFEAGPGTVTQSPEWGQIREWLTAFGEDQLVAGDFGFYDKKMAAALIIYAFTVFAKLHEIAGFSPTECRTIMCIGYDIAYSICNFRGDLVEFFGTNPSGHSLTVIINSFVNSIYMRYAYHQSNPLREARSFRKNVHLFTYGDDNAMGIRKLCSWFHHTAIRDVMATIGVEYTMADKHTQSIPYININDVSFLKRKWRWDDEVGAWLCPLDMASMHKTLTVWLPSKTLDETAQMVEIIICVNNELFFHGRKEFEKHHGFFKSIFDRYPYNCIEKTKQLLTFDELIERYQSQNNVPEIISEECDEDLAVPSQEN